ncbi:MAG: sulfatase-like hydrolase/transferase [Dysgonamonadaceae bacterium]|jgi:arylsulfatase A-like enzyme|nr:sulfatase-like hydrolase/transferase [Dysgonamonadaceae bacterium]
MTYCTLIKKSLFTSIGVGCLLASSNVFAQAPENIQRPNILFLFADDMQSNSIHALGNSEVITPNLDRLVRNGTSFVNTYIMGSTAGAVSIPSRAMLMTGRHLFSLDGAGENIPQEHTTIGEALQNAGYRTFGTGKWHNGRPAFHRSFTDGGDIFFGGMTDQWNVQVYDFDPEGKYSARIPYIINFQTQAVGFRDGDRINSGYHSSELFSDRAIDFINSYDDENPFFMFVSYLAPHDPRVMPPEFLAMYDTEKIALPPNFMPEHPFDNGELIIRDESLLPVPRDPAKVKIEIIRYYAMITHLDQQIGRVIDALKKSGLYENTIIVFAADNGIAVGQHGLLGKQNVYEHSIGVPLIISGQGFEAGKKDERFTYLSDLFPTFCDLAQILIPASVESISIFSPERRDVMFFAYRHFQRAVRQGDYKLIEYHVNDVETLQLFNLKNDPWEINNLANDRRYSRKIAEMRKLLVEQKEEYEPRGVN